jgi:hypothetical protein
MLGEPHAYRSTRITAAGLDRRQPANGCPPVPAALKAV